MSINFDEIIKVPDGIKISKNKYGFCLIATKEFKTVLQNPVKSGHFICYLKIY